MKQNGRPAYPENQYDVWLQEMGPFLRTGMSLNQALVKAGLSLHKDSIYRKYRLNDWFCEKITVFQSYPGELVNAIFARRIEALYEQALLGEPLNKYDVRLLCFAAGKHRSCRPFFVSRSEVSKAKRTDIGKVIYSLGD